MIAGLVLAAGESSRMGQDKALLLYHGRTFLETIVATMRETGIARIAVVLGHHAKEIERQVELSGVEVVVNRDYRCGQTSSLQAGLRALNSPDLEALLLCLVDHPAVRAATVEKLIETFQASHPPVVIPTFQNQRGHPVLIGSALFGELLSLGPEEGANTVVGKYREETRFLEVPDPGVTIDVDDFEAFRRLDGEAR